MGLFPFKSPPTTIELAAPVMRSSSSPMIKAREMIAVFERLVLECHTVGQFIFL